MGRKQNTDKEHAYRLPIQKIAKIELHPYHCWFFLNSVSTGYIFSKAVKISSLD